MTYIAKFENWLENADKNDSIFEELKNIENNTEEIEERFGADLYFGTAGIRGVMGAGTNRMNVYTIRKASLGVARFVKNSGCEGGVAIGYDTRKNSLVFAKAAAEVIATQGIKVYLFKTALPLSLLSFAVRELKCSAGIVITASHNSKQYNGFKVYAAHGGQITHEAQALAHEFGRISDVFKIEHRMFNDLILRGKIVYIPDSLYESYISKIAAKRLSLIANKKLKIVYAPLCGTGTAPVPDLLRRLGYKNVFIVGEQCVLDGEFASCPRPNPELSENLVAAERLAEETNADIIIATDPDADRIVLSCRTENGFYKFTGNELGALMTDYILSRLSEKGKLTKDSLIIKSVVTADLGFAIAKNYGVSVRNVLVGFKYVGEILADMESKNNEHKFVYGYEESCGGLFGSVCRDKDALIMTMLIADMCQELKQKRKDAYTALMQLYKKYGYYFSRVVNLEFGGARGIKKMNERMAQLRQKPFEEICGHKLKTNDYRESMDGLPSADMLEFSFGESRVMIRPSGTEPLLKIYILLKSKSREEGEELLLKIEKEMREYFGREV